LEGFMSKFTIDSYWSPYNNVIIGNDLAMGKVINKIPLE
ncbi:MAG: hypothetical protein K0S80_5064, partial [Neobacillus sp.]|nr:hypothetical protein [Neobacillus sp.]